jgi:hypothetical protein
MAANIARIQPALNLAMNTILTCYCRSQIFQVSHIVKGLTCYVHFVILVTRHKHTHLEWSVHRHDNVNAYFRPFLGKLGTIFAIQTNCLLVCLFVVGNELQLIICWP